MLTECQILSRLASDLYGNAILTVVKKKVSYKGYEAEVYIVQYCVKIGLKKRCKIVKT